MDDTAATRRAGAVFDDAVQTEDRHSRDLQQALRNRADLERGSAEAEDRVQVAERALAEARLDQAAQESQLARRQGVERALKAALVAEQDALRRLAAAVVAAGPIDEWAWLGDEADYSAGDRRQVIRRRTVSQQSRRVDATRKPWRGARGARMAQERRLSRSRTAALVATGRRDDAAAERDGLLGQLAQAQSEAIDRRRDLDIAVVEVAQAVVGRRRARLTAPVSGVDLPMVALDAYWRAAAAAPCRIPWWVLAGVGRVESGHGTAQGAQLSPDGTTSRRILGIPLDGRPGTFAIGDSDGGGLDSDPVWDRAVGPMQFIPSTWKRWRADDNRDGIADPHNLYDAAGAAANYLCYGRSDLTADGPIRGALFSYNHSVPYGNVVLDLALRYRSQIAIADVATDPVGG